MTDTTLTDLDKKMDERFAQLPSVVQDAITSADTEKNLRALADTHSLHVDQWQLLENEVMLALLGFQPLESLAQNIEKEVGTTKEIAASLTSDISRILFEPIREELERGLGAPQAKAEQASDIDKLRDAVLSEAPKHSPAAVLPSTPPAPKPTVGTIVVPGNASYKPGVPSHERKVIADDPYREQP